jgi:hypothetical protein
MMLAACLVSIGILRAQRDELRSFFLGKEVTLKIDLPATYKGIDLRFDQPEPLNWEQYSGRLKRSGISLTKGQRVTVTAIVVKKNMVEIHLDGGGFRTFKDRSFVSESATPVDKRRERTERGLDLENSGRQSEQSRRDRGAYTRSEAERQVLRRHGGSRFNLRWKVAVDVTPDYVMRKLKPYIDFGELEISQPARARLEPGSRTRQ